MDDMQLFCGDCLEVCVRDAHIQATILHCKALDIIKEGLTREWASPEEFKKWQDEKMNELFKDERD